MLNNGILVNSKQCKSSPITVFEYSREQHKDHRLLPGKKREGGEEETVHRLTVVSLGFAALGAGGQYVSP